MADKGGPEGIPGVGRNLSTARKCFPKEMKINNERGRCQWLTPVLLETREAEIRRMKV
jgi:hypothetical protein